MTCLWPWSVHAGLRCAHVAGCQCLRSAVRLLLLPLLCPDWPQWLLLPYCSTGCQCCPVCCALPRPLPTCLRPCRTATLRQAPSAATLPPHQRWGGAATAHPIFRYVSPKTASSFASCRLLPMLVWRAGVRQLPRSRLHLAARPVVLAVRRPHMCSSQPPALPENACLTVTACPTCLPEGNGARQGGRATLPVGRQRRGVRPAAAAAASQPAAA
jgi:hypothetical protein